MARGFPQEVWGSKPQAGLPSLQHQSGKRTQLTSNYESSRVSVCQGEMAGDLENHLKGQCTKFCWQPLTPGSGKGRAECTRDTLRESGIGGSGEGTEGTVVRIPVLSHSL